MRDTESSECTDLSVPAGLRYVRVLRLATAGVLSTNIYDVDFIEDVRAAVGEAAALVLGEHGSPGRLHLTIDCDDDSVDVVVAGVFDGSPVRDADRDVMAELMLRPLVDSYEVRADTHTVSFTKLRRPSDHDRRERAG